MAAMPGVFVSGWFCCGRGCFSMLDGFVMKERGMGIGGELNEGWSIRSDDSDLEHHLILFF